MGFLILLFIIFILTVLLIVIFSPDKMGEEENFKAKVKDLWGIVKICQTASFGIPTLELKPAKRSVLLHLHFLDADTVSMSLPLLLKKQQKAKADYLKLFLNHNLKVFDLDNKLTVHLDRQNENLGELIAHLYREVFEASDADIVKFTAKTLKTDIKVFDRFKNSNNDFYDSYAFEAPSSQHRGKSALRVIMERILGAAYFLLYPPLIILSYKSGGLTGMSWAAIVFFGFFALYNPIYKKTSIFESMVRGSILYCVLLSATLATQNITFLQSIPSVIGISTALIAAALVLGIMQPKSEKDIMEKRERRREYIFKQSFWVLGGVGLLLMSEWARRSLSLEGWVWFFAFIRIELMIAMIVIFAPAYAFFLSTKKNTKN